MPSKPMICSVINEKNEKNEGVVRLRISYVLYPLGYGSLRNRKGKHIYKDKVSRRSRAHSESVNLKFSRRSR